MGQIAKCFPWQWLLCAKNMDYLRNGFHGNGCYGADPQQATIAIVLLWKVS